MLTERMRYLLNAATEALADGQLPLSDPFIREHEVSFDEAHILADLIVIVLRSFLKMPMHQQAATYIAGATDAGIDIGYITSIAIREDCIGQLRKVDRMMGMQREAQPQG